MERKIIIRRQRRGPFKRNLEKVMKCFCSGEQQRAFGEMEPSSESIGTKNHSLGGYSSKDGVIEQKLDTSNIDTSNIEEAELSLREHGSLNYEEARALLGKIEYQKGNIEAALHVFEGIETAALIPKMKVSLARRENQKRYPQNFSGPPMSLHGVSLLLEAMFLKAKSLQHLGRFQEAAQSCKVILDIVESSLPEGLPENFAADCKLQEILNKAAELLPELWKLAGSPNEAIISYRWALLHHWNLDAESIARIQKEFAIFLLYSGGEASPPNLRSQMDSSFVPKNNMEEAILLLMILLRKASHKRVEWDPSILEHLSFALSVSGDVKALAKQVEELIPGTIERSEMYYTLGLCYYGAGEDLAALSLFRKLLHSSIDPKCVPALLMASHICVSNPELAGEGINYACRVLDNLEILKSECNQLESVANYLLGRSLSAHCKSTVADSDRVTRQSEALHALETAARLTGILDSNILYHLSIENAGQRKLDLALYYAKRLVKLESGSNIKGWLLLVRILSAQKNFIDAETIINAALDQTGKWDQGELLRTKAKLQIAQGRLRSAIKTYTQLLGVLQVQNKSFSSGKKIRKGNGHADRSMELEVWHDLASIYINLSRFPDAEICLAKSKVICYYSASRFHITGVLYERKGQQQEALKAYMSALSIDPTHVPSLVSTAVLLRSLGNQSNDVVRSFLMEALRLDRMNPSAWFNLGLLYKDKGTSSFALEAAECFEAAAFLEESAPVEPFR